MSNVQRSSYLLNAPTTSNVVSVQSLTSPNHAPTYKDLRNAQPVVKHIPPLVTNVKHDRQLNLQNLNSSFRSAQLKLQHKLPDQSLPSTNRSPLTKFLLSSLLLFKISIHFNAITSFNKSNTQPDQP